METLRKQKNNQRKQMKTDIIEKKSGLQKLWPGLKLKGQTLSTEQSRICKEEMKS